MSDYIRINRGLDIRLKGMADKIYLKADTPAFCAIKPPDFHGLFPKLILKQGEEVKIGSKLFYDKYHPEIKYTSPVTGQVHEIRRGERRVIQEVIIKVSDKEEYVSFTSGDPLTMSRDEVIEILLESGMWPVIRQRPYSIVANPADFPKSVFISGFDTAPLAPDIDFIVKDNETGFQKGIDVLFQLTKGKIHLCVDSRYPVCKTFSNAKNVTFHKISGPHPAGNVGIQIHHIDPVNKGDIVWYVSPRDVISLGNLFIKGRVDNTTVIALTGSEVKKPVYYKVLRGTSLSAILNDNIKEEGVRVISGNVLTGTHISKEGFLGFYDNQVTVIPEGKKHEFLGWAMPGFNKFSFYRAFWSWLNPDAQYRIDTNLKGGRRSLVLTGQYEKVIPLDIYPMQLIKAILTEDIDQMEKLGIYEVAEEDFALAEFICPSKTEIQRLIRHGLDLIRKEME